MNRKATVKAVRKWLGNGRIVAEELFDGATRTTKRIRRRTNRSPLKKAAIATGALAGAAGLAALGYGAKRLLIDERKEEEPIEAEPYSPSESDEEARSPQVH